jgi:membrane carboxypeptidase/penicillin-binding protein PbpC
MKQGTTDKLADKMSNMEDKERVGQTGKGLLSSEAICPQTIILTEYCTPDRISSEGACMKEGIRVGMQDAWAVSCSDF